MLQQTDQIASVFYSDGKNLAENFIPDSFSLEDIFTAMANQYVAIDKLIESFVSRCNQSNINIDCKKGCEYCCHQPVFANIQEVLYVIAYMKQNFTVSQLNDAKRRAFEKAKKTDSTSAKELLKHSHACPLLENGVCSVYSVRPMACRIYMSSDVSSCIKRYELSENSTFPSLFEFLLIAGRNMNSGFSSRLSNLGLQVTENRFEILLYLLLSEPNNRVTWLQGNEIIHSVEIM